MATTRLGKIERKIWRAFIAEPGSELSTIELVQLAFPRLPAGELKRSHWYSVRRAAESVAFRVGRKRPGGLVWAAVGSNSGSKAHSANSNSESDQSLS
jgi:hypothetical protein